MDLITFNCPKCKHETLAERRSHKYNNYGIKESPNAIYCFSCGKYWEIETSSKCVTLPSTLK